MSWAELSWSEILLGRVVLSELSLGRVVLHPLLPVCISCVYLCVAQCRESDDRERCKSPIGLILCESVVTERKRNHLTQILDMNSCGVTFACIIVTLSVRSAFSGKTVIVIFDFCLTKLLFVIVYLAAYSCIVATV